MSRARLNGIEIDYEVSGSGPPVLLSHGYSATRRMWDGQHRAFNDYQVISWSMRGHGQTDSPREPSKYSADLTVADMAALLRHVRQPRAVIEALAGRLRLAGLYLAHPEMVRALVSLRFGGRAIATPERAPPGINVPRSAPGLESCGLDALSGRSREMREAMGEHRSAQGLARPRGMLGQEGCR
jgi:pimeloyl-ACP methyl ester carboxylesterase